MNENWRRNLAYILIPPGLGVMKKKKKKLHKKYTFHSFSCHLSYFSKLRHEKREIKKKKSQKLKEVGVPNILDHIHTLTPLMHIQQFSYFTLLSLLSFTSLVSFNQGTRTTPACVTGSSIKGREKVGHVGYLGQGRASGTPFVSLILKQIKPREYTNNIKIQTNFFSRTLIFFSYSLSLSLLFFFFSFNNQWYYNTSLAITSYPSRSRDRPTWHFSKS